MEKKDKHKLADILLYSWLAILSVYMIIIVIKFIIEPTWVFLILILVNIVNLTSLLNAKYNLISKVKEKRIQAKNDKGWFRFHYNFSIYFLNYTPYYLFLTTKYLNLDISSTTSEHQSLQLNLPKDFIKSLYDKLSNKKNNWIYIPKESQQILDKEIKKQIIKAKLKGEL